jgi:peptidoglycan/LPS O-acetylase OafA/YrhL
MSKEELSADSTIKVSLIVQTEGRREVISALVWQLFRAGAPQWDPFWRRWRAARFFEARSFHLYLFHMPAATLIFQWTRAYEMPLALYFTVNLGLTLAFSSAVALILERLRALWPIYKGVTHAEKPG